MYGTLASRSKFVSVHHDFLRQKNARPRKFKARTSAKVALLSRYDPAGDKSLRELAAIFDDNGIATVSGKGSWSANSVRRLKALA